MSPDVADLVVMIVVGALLGAVMKLFMSISGMDDSVKRTADRARRPLKERLADAFDSKKVKAENDARLKSMPRSGWTALVFLYGLVIMLAVVVRVSPISMRWWPFLGSTLGAFMLAEFVFSRTRTVSRKACEKASTDVRD